MKKNVKKCFKNLHISKKSIIFASKFSNLCYIKAVFNLSIMKEKNLIKLVYRLLDGHYVRYGIGTIHYLSTDFPLLKNFDPCYNSRLYRCDFLHENYFGKAWIDKHDNVIVRCMCDNIKQLKIDF